MPLSNMTSRSPGYVITAANDWNKMVANINEMLQYAAAGKILISTSATTLTTITFRRFVSVQLCTDVALATGDDKARILIPPDLNGWILDYVAASRQSGTGVPLIQIRNVTAGVDMLSTRISIDSGEVDSSTAAAPAVIDTSNDAVAGYNQIAVDVDAAGTGSLSVTVLLGFSLP